jgi:hypothetical protein
MILKIILKKKASSRKLQAASNKQQAQPEVVFNEYIFPDLPPLLYRII